MSQLLRGARVVDPQVGLDGPADVRIADDGTIAQVADAIDPLEEEDVLDLTGMVLIPGLVDIHVHFRDPGQEHKETIEGGVASAAHGGYTDVATMPNTTPACDGASVVAYQVEKAAAAGLARVHPIGAITKGLKQESLAEIGDMHAAGVKAFSDDGRGVQPSGLLRTAMDYISQFDGVAISHCQDESLVGKGVVNEGAASTRLGLAGWPAEGEEVQIARDALLSELTGCRLHVAHVTTARGVEMVDEAKRRGASVTCEVCPHHLFLCEDDITDDFDTNYKMNPPLRTRADMEALQQALVDGRIDCVVSDHAPHAAHEKALEFEAAPFGILGLETELPLVLTNLVNTGRMGWDRLVQTMCVNPRSVAGMDAVKIEKGCEATLTCIDPHARFTVTEDFLQSKSKNTPFIGAELDGRAMYAWVEGKPILVAGEVAAR